MRDHLHGVLATLGLVNQNSPFVLDDPKLHHGISAVTLNGEPLHPSLYRVRKWRDRTTISFDCRGSYTVTMRLPL